MHAFAGLISAAHGLLLAGRGALTPLQYLIDAVALEVDRRILLGEGVGLLGRLAVSARLNRLDESRLLAGVLLVRAELLLNGALNTDFLATG